MDMPKLTAQHKKLAKFVGNWKGDESIHPMPWDPKGGPATGVSKCKLVGGDFHLLMEYQQKRGKTVTHIGHGVIGYHPEKKQYSMNWFDNMGSGAEPAYGTWNGAKLVFQAAGPMGHSRYTFSITKPDSYRFMMEMSEDGTNWALVMAGHYKKQVKA
jgi:hypothetical protein